MTDLEHQREHIEHAIARARAGVGDRIDELDREIRGRMSFNQMMSENAPQLAAIGLGLGFLIGFGTPKLLGRTIQIGVPLLLAFKAAKRRASRR